MPTRGQRAAWSIVQEASARKVGNVHPDASFEDMTHATFLSAAHAIGEALDRSQTLGLGDTVLACTVAMLNEVQVNTSLGTLLLIVPLAICDAECGDAAATGDASVQRDEVRIPSDSSMVAYLSRTHAADARRIYEAIAACKPGGLGASKTWDVHSQPPENILVAMRIASEWDDVALQYANGFLQVAEYGRRLKSMLEGGCLLSDAIRSLQIEILAERPDSLIVRKHGKEQGERIMQHARACLQSGPYGSPAYEAQWAALDQELRNPSKRMNPGTTADLIAASLYTIAHAWM